MNKPKENSLLATEFNLKVKDLNEQQLKAYNRSREQKTRERRNINNIDAILKSFIKESNFDITPLDFLSSQEQQLESIFKSSKTKLKLNEQQTIYNQLQLLTQIKNALERSNKI